MKRCRECMRKVMENRRCVECVVSVFAVCNRRRGCVLHQNFLDNSEMPGLRHERVLMDSHDDRIYEPIIGCGSQMKYAMMML